MPIGWPTHLVAKCAKLIDRQLLVNCHHCPAMSAIAVENLSFSYGSNKILNDICIEIERKQIYALLGPSGGGKTTLLKLILGTIKNKNGLIRVMGEDSGLKSRANISFMPQDSGLYPHFSVNQTFSYFKNIYRLSDSQYKKRYAL